VTSHQKLFQIIETFGTNINVHLETYTKASRTLDAYYHGTPIKKTWKRTWKREAIKTEIIKGQLTFEDRMISN